MDSFPDLRCLVFLIIIMDKVKWHPCSALLLASVVLGIIARMDIPDVADAVQTGAGKIALIVGLGAKLGKAMAECVNRNSHVYWTCFWFLNI
ncbi:GntT/GntP/DsdX family permease [Peribacillus aracenensis]|uniref:GntT/GntP/DsdX family permease n=1 Tax=Peribacillus aracenensis TaxID=2976708 RepID=UPI0021A70A18|nr:hypothetical protein [Peribacillus sp. BBB004]